MRDHALFAMLVLAGCSSAAASTMPPHVVRIAQVDAPDSNARAALSSIMSALKTLPDQTAASYVGYALNNQVTVCGANWPKSPTVPEVDVYQSACWLLQNPLLSPADVAYVLANVPTYSAGSVTQ